MVFLQHFLKGSYTFVVLTSLFITASSGCGDTDTETDESITWQDYACTADNDCVIMQVPRCCGNKMERYSECVNKDYVPPDQIGCADNRTCADMILPVSCVCETFADDNPDTPERMCNGVEAETADAGQ